MARHPIDTPRTRLWRQARKTNKKERVTDRDLIRFGSPSQRSCITFVNSAFRPRRGLTEQRHWVRHLSYPFPATHFGKETDGIKRGTAAVFAPVVFRDLPGENISPISKRDFIMLFIT